MRCKSASRPVGCIEYPLRYKRKRQREENDRILLRQAYPQLAIRGSTGESRQIGKRLHRRSDDALFLIFARIDVESASRLLPPVPLFVHVLEGPVRFGGLGAPPQTESVKELHPAVKATAAALRRAKPSVGGVVQVTGPGICQISIAVASVERIISILDRLACGINLGPAETLVAAAVGPDLVRC